MAHDPVERACTFGVSTLCPRFRVVWGWIIVKIVNFLCSESVNRLMKTSQGLAQATEVLNTKPLEPYPRRPLELNFESYDIIYGWRMILYMWEGTQVQALQTDFLQNE